MKTSIIAGTKKGLKLDNPTRGTRPLTNRIKQSLFDLINDFVSEAEVLDLYAGGGNFGIEALSRGAKQATFVDLSQNSIDTIEDNLYKAGFSLDAKLKKENVQDFVLANSDPEFDIIMTDPPFDDVIIEHIKDATRLLKKNGVFIFRHPTSFENPNKLGGLTKTYSKKYGVSTVSFYQYPAN